jgi:nitroreductase
LLDQGDRIACLALTAAVLAAAALGIGWLATMVWPR